MRSARFTFGSTGSSNASSLRWRRFGWTVLVALIASMAAACADSDSDRRFANDPLPTEDIGAQPTVAQTAFVPDPTRPPATPVTSEQLLSIVGTSPRLFVQSGSRIVSVTIDGSNSRTVFDAGDDSILALSGSPNGELLAVMVANAAKSQISITLVNPNAEKIATTEMPVGSTATPAAVGAGRYRLEWSPSNDRLLVTLETGGIHEVDVAGTIRTIRDPSQAPSPKAVTWSPAGSAIAFVDAGADGKATGLYVASIDVLPVDPVEIIRPVEGRSRQIVDIQWGAGTKGIYYSERAANGDLSIGGDLFVVSSSGGSPKLIASAAGVAQASAIGTFIVSPDGTAVAYTVIAPGANGVFAHSLHLSQIDGPTSIGLTIRGSFVVDELEWTSFGLAWGAHVISGDGNWNLIQVAQPDGRVRTVYSEEPKGTPVASPATLSSPVARNSPG